MTGSTKYKRGINPNPREKGRPSLLCSLNQDNYNNFVISLLLGLLINYKHYWHHYLVYLL